MDILGQFNLGFIIARLGRDLFIIDQHASGGRPCVWKSRVTCSDWQELRVACTPNTTPSAASNFSTSPSPNADEKANFERLQSEVKFGCQPLLTSQKLDLCPMEELVVRWVPIMGGGVIIM